MVNKLAVILFVVSLVGGIAVNQYLTQPPPVTSARPVAEPVAPSAKIAEPVAPAIDGWRIVSITHHGEVVVHPTSPVITPEVRHERRLMDQTPMLGPPGVNSYEHNFNGTGRGHF